MVVADLPPPLSTDNSSWQEENFTIRITHLLSEIFVSFENNPPSKKKPFTHVSLVNNNVLFNNCLYLLPLSWPLLYCENEENIFARMKSMKMDSCKIFTDVESSASVTSNVTMELQ